MAFDQYADEPAVEIDAHLLTAWRAAKSAISQWEAEEKRLRELLEKQIGDAHAGLVDGEKVIYHRPIKTYRVKALLAENAELASHYYVPGPEVFAMDRFAKAFPEIAEKYRSRAFKDAS